MGKGKPEDNNALDSPDPDPKTPVCRLTPLPFISPKAGLHNVTPIISYFFLRSYALIDLGCFYTSFSQSPGQYGQILGSGPGLGGPRRVEGASLGYKRG